MKKQKNENVQNNLPETFTLKVITGYKKSLPKAIQFFKSVHYKLTAIREFLLLFYKLPEEEFEKYKKLWKGIQEHLKERMYHALRLTPHQTEQERLELEKKGVKRLIDHLAQCYVEGIFGERKPTTVLKVFLQILKTSYKTSTLVRMFHEKINELKEGEENQKQEKINKQ
ncbi:MAG: hypothetical protein LUG51_00845 [Tannerellaceae bacterium]|nr:hypothetical protein [Tannerellaceae bacterium]